MASPPKPGIKGFEGAEAKLKAPAKKTAYQREQEAKEAKLRRNQAEDAAVLAEIEKEFGTPDDNTGPPSGPSAARRGGLGSGRGIAGHRPTPTSQRPGGSGGLDISLAAPPSRRPKTGVHAHRLSDSDDEEEAQSKSDETAVKKPTLALKSLPLRYSRDAIESNLQNLNVDDVRFINPANRDRDRNSNSLPRKSNGATVILAVDTPASEINKKVGALHGKYLGWGSYLDISRGLPTTAASSKKTQPPDFVTAPPAPLFGAEEQPIPVPTLNRVAPPSNYRGSGPVSSSYNGRGLYKSLRVTVKAPTNIDELRKIHSVIEGVVKNGIEFESLLRKQPMVERQEAWAWLWDPRSRGGVYYRWKLWEVCTRHKRHGKVPEPGSVTHPFGREIPWVAPAKNSFEEIVAVGDIYDSVEFDNSSDEDDEELRHDDDRPQHLNPALAAELVQYLRDLPTSVSSMHKRELGAVVNFVIKHPEAINEIVDVLVANVEGPFAYHAAGADNAMNADAKVEEGESDIKIEDGEPTEENKSQVKKKDVVWEAKVIGLYCITEVLRNSAAPTAKKGAWRYRTSLGTALSHRKTFEKLAKYQKDVKIVTDTNRYRFRIQSVLDSWALMNCFQSSILDQLRKDFNRYQKPETGNDTGTDKAEVADQDQKPKNGDDSKKRKNDDMEPCSDYQVATTDMQDMSLKNNTAYTNSGIIDQDGWGAQQASMAGVAGEKPFNLQEAADQLNAIEEDFMMGADFSKDNDMTTATSADTACE